MSSLPVIIHPYLCREGCEVNFFKETVLNNLSNKFFTLFKSPQLFWVYRNKFDKPLNFLSGRLAVYIFIIQDIHKSPYLFISGILIKYKTSEQGVNNETVIPLLKRFPVTAFPESTAYMNFSSAGYPEMF
jgi:hypothetical protein